MPNLKQDLIVKLRGDKYYEEIELGRLAQEPNMNYQKKIDGMIDILQRIGDINVSMNLIEQYFPDQVQAQNQTPEQKPAGQVHQGQTHGEQI